MDSSYRNNLVQFHDDVDHIAWVERLNLAKNKCIRNETKADIYRQHTVHLRP